MKLLFDFFPIVLFFIAYKFFGTYVATVVTMAASLLQIGTFWLKHHRIEFMHAITLVVVIILGGATLLAHNEIFIKWKPTTVYWVFAVLFLGSQAIGSKPMLQHMMGSKITLPKDVWQRLNLSWAAFFVFMGGVNLYVAYQFDTNIWVNFKLFGLLGSTLAFGISQAIYLAKYLKKPEME